VRLELSDRIEQVRDDSQCRGFILMSFTMTSSFTRLPTDRYMLLLQVREEVDASARDLPDQSLC
jgi:hypothetical protein